jgi:hypothetical protein
MSILLYNKNQIQDLTYIYNYELLENHMGIYEKNKKGEKLMCIFMSMLYDKIKSEA